MTDGPIRERAATEERSGARRDRERPPAPEPLPHPVVDNHCHLDIADGDWLATEEAIAAAAAVNVTRIVQIGCDLPGARWAVEAAQRHDAVVAGVALHPNEAPRLAAAGGLAAAYDEIERLARSHERVRAVGETGLDHFRTGEDGRAAQEESFRWHVDLAKRLDKTLVIHDRDAHDDVLRVLDSEGVPDRWVMHCFSGDADFAQGLPGPRRPPQLRRHGHVQERRGAAQRARGDPRRPAARGDRRAVPDPRAVARPTQRVVPRPAHRAGDGGGPRRGPRRALCGHRRDHRGGVRGLVVRVRHVTRCVRGFVVTAPARYRFVIVGRDRDRFTGRYQGWTPVVRPAKTPVSRSPTHR